MNKTALWLVLITIGITATFILFPDCALAQVIGGGGFEDKLTGLTNKIINVILPAVSILGLVYAAILATTGDAAAKQRMVFIVIASIIGFLAPIIISWFKSASGA